MGEQLTMSQYGSFTGGKSILRSWQAVLTRFDACAKEHRALPA